VSTVEFKQFIESTAISLRVPAHGWHLAHVGEEWFEMKTPPGFVPKIYRAQQS